MAIFSYFILFLLLIIMIGFATAGVSFAPWVPSRIKDLKRIENLANIKENNIFYELGCGNGRIVFYLARKYPQAKFIGLEIYWPLYLFCQLRKWLGHYQNVRFYLKNLYHQDLSQADIVYIFGMPRTIKNKLEQKFLDELKVGAKIISYSFSVKGLSPTEVSKPQKKDLPIFLYTIK